MIEKPQAIIFDLDDTLINFTGAAGDCWRMAYRRFADELPSLSEDEFAQTLKDYADWFWSDSERHRLGRLDLLQTRRDIVAEALARLNAGTKELGYLIADAYSAARSEALRTFPETHDVLTTLAARGIRLAMITNGRTDLQRAKIERFDLARHFEYILVEGEFGMGKPMEPVYRHTLGQLDLPPEETWMVGDNLEWDVFAPQKLGIGGVWMNFKEKSLPEGPQRPDRVIRRLDELARGF